MEPDPIVSRLARLEALDAARSALARYGRACDAKDVELLRTDVFVPDAVLRLPTTVVRGADAIAEFYAAAFAAEPGIRRHLIVNAVAEIDSDGTVGVDSYFFFVSQDRESVLGWGSYRDLVEVTDGFGRIREKEIRLDVHTTLTAGWALGDRAGTAEAPAAAS